MPGIDGELYWDDTTGLKQYLKDQREALERKNIQAVERLFVLPKHNQELVKAKDKRTKGFIRAIRLNEDNGIKVKISYRDDVSDFVIFIPTREENKCGVTYRFTKDINGKNQATIITRDKKEYEDRTGEFDDAWHDADDVSTFVKRFELQSLYDELVEK